MNVIKFNSLCSDLQPGIIRACLDTLTIEELLRISIQQEKLLLRLHSQEEPV